VNVAVVPAPFKDVLPEMEVPDASLSVNVTEDAVTVWLKVALGVTLAATPVAPEAGEVELTVGAGGAATVVKLHEYGAMVWPVELVAPVTVAVY
jgi:hypothetical protein